MQKRRRQFFEFAAGTRVLLVSFGGVMLMTLLVFPMLPLGGHMIDLKLNDTLTDIHLSMLQYGESGRAIYELLAVVFLAVYLSRRLRSWYAGFW